MIAKQASKRLSDFRWNDPKGLVMVDPWGTRVIVVVLFLLWEWMFTEG
jgi:hypothetical protein